MVRMHGVKVNCLTTGGLTDIQGGKRTVWLKEDLL